jgi:threonine dehydrogenase-like Zn-dependent dehydrogenase
MKATLIYGPRDIRFETVPDPQIQRPTDALVRVVASCVCGSDLWPYRGVTPTDEPHCIGHEFIGDGRAPGDQGAAAPLASLACAERQVVNRHKRRENYLCQLFHRSS